MHETSIASSIIDTAMRLVEENGGGELQSVRVAVGELAAVEPDLLQFAWEALVHDCVPPPMLEVEWRPARQTCPHCRRPATRAAGSWLRICTDCGQPLQVEGGQELDILEVVFDQKADNERESTETP